MHKTKTKTIFKILPIILLIFTHCNNNRQSEDTERSVMQYKDMHTFSKPDQAVVRHLDLDIIVDFDKKIITGKAAYTIENIKGVNKIYFDSRDLKIEKITLGKEEKDTKFQLGAFVEYLGQPLEILIEDNTKIVNIYYSTNPGSVALQWLEPQQTAGKKHPFLFTQSEPGFARTWVPCQDSPGIRFTYTAKVQVPGGILVIMSAENPTQITPDGNYNFKMDQPIPAYLLALAAGDLQFKATGERTGVYAEPSVIDKAVYEFAEMEDMLLTTEKLYGLYRWDRYDVVVLPPSFPFGGMENPRVTFVTPTILAGDRSLVSLIAHEMAHSWSGNLVTNATWNDFWLNEGFTVYIERRIMEELYGKSYADMLAVLGYQDLEDDIKKLSADDTKLKLNLTGRDPDEAMTNVAYEKGALFLKTIEEAMGRERWDGFLKQYFDTFSFQTMSTEKFVEYLKNELGNAPDATELLKQIAIDDWVYKPGIPGNFKVYSDRFKQVDEQIKHWKQGTPVPDLYVKEWTTHEWLHFLRHLPEKMSLEQMGELDSSFEFTNSGNAEILCAWYLHVIENKYTAALPALEKFLLNVGRRKFLKPLYKAMVKTEDGKEMAKAIYSKARPNYHFISVNTIDEIVGK
ncbi:MAG: M1 family metallopeptidase [Cytophagales bacterium]|nr:M1 family metallopeptidase [Cytophagales bacterium]